jgi:hypothetical protein
MAETTNLKLQKPIDNDTTWGDDFRGAMDIIDANPGIKVVADDTAKTALSVDSWEGRLCYQLDNNMVYKYNSATWDIVGALEALTLADFAEDPDNHSGLDFAYKAGKVRYDNVVNIVIAGTVILADDDTNYIEVLPSDGTVSANVVGFTTGSIPLFEVVTVSGAIDTVADKRAFITSGGQSILTTKGDLLVHTGSALARLGVGTNGQVLIADSGQTNGMRWGTGGGGGVPERWYIPGSADEGFDDEFDDGGIAGWTAIDVEGKVNEWYEPTGLKGLSGIFPSGKMAHDISGQLKSMGAMAAPCYIETAVKILAPYYAANYPSVGLIFADGVTIGAGKQVTAGLTIGTWSAQKRFTIGSVEHTNYQSRTTSSEVELIPFTSDRLYLRFAYTAANKFRIYFSLDGITWHDALGEKAYTITPTHFGIIQTTNDNCNIAYSGNWAYFRARAGAPANG